MLDCEEKRQADRANLRLLKFGHPDWTNSQFAAALSRSLSWVKKWLARLKQAPSSDSSILFSQKRGRKTPFPPTNPLVVDRILAIRDQPPDNLKCTPGPKAIAYYLAKDKVLVEQGLKPPTSASTIWRILTKLVMSNKRNVKCIIHQVQHLGCSLNFLIPSLKKS